MLHGVFRLEKKTNGRLYIKCEFPKRVSAQPMKYSTISALCIQTVVSIGQTHTVY